MRFIILIFITIHLRAQIPVSSFTVNCSTPPFVENFGSLNIFLPYNYSTADPSYTTAIDCFNGYIVSNNSGIESSTGIITSDFNSDGSSSHFLYHETSSTTSACTYTPNMAVWLNSANIYVIPNEIYEFSYYCWLDRVDLAIPVLSQTIIPTLGIATILSSTSNTLNTITWIQNKITFSVSAATSISLKIINSTIDPNGNDFGIDNIVLKTIPPTLTITASSNSICAGSNSTLTATGATNYTWTPSLITGSLAVVSQTTNSIYTVNSFYGFGCPISQSITIITKSSPTITTSDSITTICASQSATLNANVGSATFTWSPVSSNTTTLVVSPSLTTTYSVTATNSIGCSSVKTITVLVIPLPSINTVSQQNVLCFGTSTGSIILTGTNTGTITPSQTTNLSAGTYTYEIIEPFGCTNNNVLTITQPTSAVFFASATQISSNNNCEPFNGSATVLPAGGTPTYNIFWDNGELGTTATALSTGIHTFTITDANGCVTSLSTGSIIITGITGITASIVSQSSVSCFSGTNGTAYFTTNIGGVNTYTLTNITTAAATTNTTGIFNNLIAGTYSVFLTGANGCITSQTLSIIQPTMEPTIHNSAISIGTINCFGNLSIVTVAATGGIGNYTYLWSNNSSTVNFATYPAGSYFVSVLDANNCASNNAPFIVNQPTSLLVSEITINETCVNQNTGSVEVAINGGTPNYTVLWNNNDTNLISKNLVAGVITATVTDANGCEVFYTSVITNKNCEQLFIPNFFTPNSNGQNDFFYIGGLSQFPNNSIQIYNRWGNLIYSKTPYDNSFDGKANVANTIGTDKLPSATYFVVFDFGDGNTKPYRGYLELKY